MGAVIEEKTIRINESNDVVTVRREAREYAEKLGFNLLEQTKIVTAASEIARNAIVFGGGGIARFTTIDKPDKRGLQISFIDHGPGIEDIEVAMKDGYTTGGGLGLGLGGTKRLMDEFHIQSEPGKGTSVTIVKYL